MSDCDSAIAGFWGWFVGQCAEILALKETDDPFWDVVLGQLRHVHDELRFELSQDAAAEREFIVTAEGKRFLFPLVDALIAQAPSIIGWKFIALKPAMGFDFYTTYEGIQFDPAKMLFRRIINHDAPSGLGFYIAVPNFTLDVKRQAENAVLVILDTALGERAAASEIDYVEVGLFLPAADSTAYHPLDQLPAYIERWKEENRKT